MKLKNLLTGVIMMPSISLFAAEINPADQMDSMIYFAFFIIIVIIVLVILGNYKYKRNNIFLVGNYKFVKQKNNLTERISFAILSSILLLLFIFYLVMDMGWIIISVWATFSFFILYTLYSVLLSAKEILNQINIRGKPTSDKSELLNLIVVSTILLGVTYLLIDDLYIVLFLIITFIISHHLLTSYFKFTQTDNLSCETKKMVIQKNQDEDVLLDHDYDGIKELDNDLPSWWLYGFYGCILFALFYLYDYHIAETSPLQAEEYEIEIKSANNEIAMNVNPIEVIRLEDEESIANGAQIYSNNCMPCHLENGGGSIGPNLTDEYWIHGGSFESIVKVVNDGVLDKGMIAWKTVLNPSQINEVSSYLLTLPNVEGKDPQGELYIVKQ
ncbi:MAG: c-type cytochrome [Flavobacteriales bacterium]|nr:c-type cytochrome [Flavobacteriales bacterium]